MLDNTEVLFSADLQQAPLHLLQGLSLNRTVIAARSGEMGGKNLIYVQALFMQQVHAWAKHKKTIELKEILAQDFFRCDGTGPIPPQIVSWVPRSVPIHKQVERFLANHVAMEDDSELVTRDSSPSSTSRLGACRAWAFEPLYSGLARYQGAESAGRLVAFQGLRNAEIEAGSDAARREDNVRQAPGLPEKCIQENEKLLMMMLPAFGWEWNSDHE